MKHRWSVRLTAAALCLAASVSAGWLWHVVTETKFEARARLACGADAFADADGPDGGEGSSGAVEELVLSTEVLASAVALLHDRGIPLSMASPFDSETDYVLNRMRVTRPDPAAPDEIQITCIAEDADETREILTAVVDAFVAGVNGGSVNGAPVNGTPPAAEDSASGESENERRQLARAVERQEHAVAALVEQLAVAKKAAEPGQSPEDLETQRLEARRAVADAEGRLDDAQRDFEKKISAEVVAARLSDGPLRTTVLERLNLARLRVDLRQQEDLLQKWSSVYGRRHPRIAEIRTTIEQLQKQIAQAPNDSGDPSQPLAESSPVMLVLNALEADLAAAQSAQQDLEGWLAVTQDRRNAEQELEAKLADARQELAFLHEENDRARKETDGARCDATSRAPVVVEQPTLAPDPIIPQAGLQIAVCCVAGMALYLLLLRQFCPRSEDAATDTRPARPSLSRRNRFLSQEEQQLARLKMLSAAQ